MKSTAEIPAKKPRAFSDWFVQCGKRHGVVEFEAKSLASEIQETWKVTLRGSDRSLEQNKFFHGPLITAFVDCFGETDREYLKAHLKEQFLTVQSSSGKEYVRSTSSLTFQEMHKFIEQSLEMLVDFGGHLPNEATIEWMAINKMEKVDKK